MSQNYKLFISQRIIQACLLLLGIIALFSGNLQMYLGEPETNARLDNIHRFMAGVYFSMGPLAIWTAMTIKKHNTLIFFLAFSVFMAGVGRIISMSIVGLPEKIFLIYLAPELCLPFIMVISQIFVNRKISQLKS